MDFVMIIFNRFYGVSTRIKARDLIIMTARFAEYGLKIPVRIFIKNHYQSHLKAVLFCYFFPDYRTETIGRLKIGNKISEQNGDDVIPLPTPTLSKGRGHFPRLSPGCFTGQGDHIT